MATFTKLNGFSEHLGKGVHIFGTHQLQVVLSNTAPGSESTPPTGAASACVKANITEISYANLSSRNVTTTSYAQTAGVGKLVLADLTLTSSGGSTGPFRYVYLVNDTPTSPADPLIGYYDYGSSITLLDTQTFSVDFDGTQGALTVA